MISSELMEFINISILMFAVVAAIKSYVVLICQYKGNQLSTVV